MEVGVSNRVVQKIKKRHLKIISYVIISKGEEEEECDENIIVYRYNAT